MIEDKDNKVKRKYKAREYSKKVRRFSLRWRGAETEAITTILWHQLCT